MSTPSTLTALAAALVFTASAAAAQTCPIGTKAPFMEDPENGLVSLEGPLAAVDTIARTVTVFDAVIEVPDSILIHTGADKYNTLNQLVDPVLEARRTVIGGTMMVEGMGSDTDGDGCLNIVANSLYFEFGEHLMVGNLTPSSIDVNNQILYVHGVPMKMNDDPRLPSRILDINGNADLDSLDDLLGFEGSVVGPEGYFEGDTLRMVVLESEAFIPNPNADNPFIEKARYEVKDRYIRVDGGVLPPGSTYVDIFAPGKIVLTADGLNRVCQGTLRGRASVLVDPAAPEEGSAFGFRSAKGGIRTDPGTVCVQSQAGGVAYRVFDQK